MMKKVYNKEIINIRVTAKQFLNINGIIEKYKKDYSDRFLKLKRIEFDNLEKFNYNVERKLISDYNSLVKELLINLFEEFKIFKLFGVSVFITGSIARISNRLNSDVDIHFVYNNFFKHVIWKYEEMYFYIAAQILGLKRNNLHSVITTKLSKDKLNYFDNVINKKELTVRIINKNNFYEYKFFPTTKKRFFLQYDNNKSLKKISYYLCCEINGLNREWAHNIYILNNSKKNNIIIKKITMFENKIINRDKINNLIDVRIKSIRQNNDIDINNIKEIKKIFQQKTYCDIYNTLNIVRMVNNYINNEKDTLYNLPKIFSSSLYKQVRNHKEITYDIYKYLWYIKRISIYCKINNIPYSIHKDGNVDIFFINDIVELKKVIDRDLISILETVYGRINYER